MVDTEIITVKYFDWKLVAADKHTGNDRTVVWLRDIINFFLLFTTDSISNTNTPLQEGSGNQNFF